jgi:group I intron endonuclease
MTPFRYESGIDVNSSMIIYKITNLINGKVYIGQTTRRLKDRFVRYVQKGIQTYFFNAIEKYGYDKFMVSIVQQCVNREELNEREQYWISFYKSTLSKHGYNSHPGGLNKEMHERTKLILSEKCSGWHHTEEARKRIGEAGKGRHLGKHYSKSHRENLSKAHMGFVFSEQRKKNFSEKMKGRKITWGDKISSTKTIPIDKDKILRMRKEGDTYQKIADSMGVSTGVIYNRINGIVAREYRKRKQDEKNMHASF